MRDRAPLPADPSLCPPLPAAALARLDDGIAALGLDPLPEEALAGIVDHLRLLLAWTASVNLTAIREPAAAVTGHVLDSLAAVPLLRAAGTEQLIDLGSGGGYPGLPLALALPADRVLLADSIAKKARFLETAVAALGLAGRVTVAATRAEALAADPRHRERWPVVTARAVAALPELVELGFPLLEPGGILVAWKRADLGAERSRALPAITALGEGRLEVVAVPTGGRTGAARMEEETALEGRQDPGASALAGLQDHVMVVIRKLGRTGPGWPRPTAERRRRPW